MIIIFLCGPDRIRTDDPLVANEVLYQLSHRPLLICVGTEGIEPSTSSLSEKCSTTEPRAQFKNELIDSIKIII